MFLDLFIIVKNWKEAKYSWKWIVIGECTDKNNDNAIIFTNKRKWTIDTCYKVDIPQKHAHWKKSDTRDQIYYFIYMKYTEKAKL